jgi:biotin-[acetyl-CoA-carboxylase] ligase BirA-like protein
VFEAVKRHETMLVLSDRYDYAAELLPPEAARRLSSPSALDSTARTLAREFLGTGSLVAGDLSGGAWSHLVLSDFSPRSQYDRMIELARAGSGLPDRLVCVVGAGEGFRGFKGRSWTAAAGNLHLTVHFAPHRPVERLETAFTVLAAVSVVEAVDTLRGLEGRAGIKWMNDVLLEGEKVGGTLAYTQSQGGTVTSAVLGIGLNVETAPPVDRSPYVPAVGSIRDHAPDPEGATRRDLLSAALGALDRNYRLLLEEGPSALLDRYRQRSVVVGRNVVVHEEGTGEGPPAVIAEGRVLGIGDQLELHIEGRKEPVRRGRLILRSGRWSDTTTRPPELDAVGAGAGDRRSPARRSPGEG